MSNVQNNGVRNENPFIAQHPADEAEQVGGGRPADVFEAAGAGNAQRGGRGRAVANRGTRAAATRHNSTVAQGARPANNARFNVNARRGQIGYDGPTSGFRDLVLAGVAVATIANLSTTRAAPAPSQQQPDTQPTGTGSSDQPPLTQLP